jgi:hypothetical protein
MTYRFFLIIDDIDAPVPVIMDVVGMDNARFRAIGVPARRMPMGTMNGLGMTAPCELALSKLIIATTF